MGYRDSFIAVSEDCPVALAEIPAIGKSKRSKAGIAYDLLVARPYHYTQEALSYAVYAAQQEQAGGVAETWDQYFSKGRPCLRASSLVKRYGWGAHYDGQGRIALVGLGSAAYVRFAGDARLAQIRGMRSKRA